MLYNIETRFASPITLQSSDIEATVIGHVHASDEDSITALGTPTLKSPLIHNDVHPILSSGEAEQNEKPGKQQENRGWILANLHVSRPKWRAKN